MKRLSNSLSRLAFLLVCTAVLRGTPLQAQTATQEVTLSAGWNAVWLEVEPRDGNGDLMAPQDVFTDASIATIATPKPLAGIAEFFGSDPGTIGTFNQDEWQQWLRTDPADSNNLPLIFGNRPYLVEVDPGTPDFNLNLTGKVRFFHPTWTPDRYNLLGFGIKGTISFQDFFAPAGGKHPLNRIFRLASNGNWSVVSPGSPIQDGAAYWIFSNGPSDFMGPVAVDFDVAALGTLNFGGPADAVTVGTAPDTLSLDLEELVFTNLGSAAATPTMELITADPGAGALALHVVGPALGTLGYVRGNQVDSTSGDGTASDLGETIAPRSTAVITLGALRNWTSGEAGRTNLYRLTTGNPGTEFWLPVGARNNDLQLPTDLLPGSEAGNVAGLWVGEVILDAVTSIVEDGAPTRPAAGSAPMRILLHSDASGAVSILSQITIMQTRTADPAVEPVPVLVVNQARIPFFEGIKERNGKRVGLRLDAVAFDMPRKLDAASQAALLADDSFPDLTEEGLADFLASSKTRPPSLAESYHFSWGMDGAIGAAKTLRTAAASPLSLDPFHRSNPFRHAFHPGHARGPNITRDLTIVFDAQQPVADRLQGSYRELLRGATKTDLELSGRLELHRISNVATLDTSP